MMMMRKHNLFLNFVAYRLNSFLVSKENELLLSLTVLKLESKI